MARVLWRDAQGKEGSIELSGQEIHIGRAMDCAIRTDDAMVSRHHARVFWGGGQYYIEDLGSANGMYYQEQRVTQHALSHGDAVRCGSLWLRFVDNQPGYGAQPVHQHQPVTPGSGGYQNPGSGAYPSYGQSQPVPQPPVPQPPMPQQVHQPASQPMAPMGGQPSSGSVPALDAGKQAEADSEEIRRLQRRIEQLQTELRLYRGGKGAEVAQRIEELENENASLEGEVEQFRKRVRELESALQAESSDARVLRADQLSSKTSETVQQLNDILSNLRINVMAAEGEFEQFSNDIPRASFELIREALRSSSSDVDTARELLRVLRDLAD